MSEQKSPLSEHQVELIKEAVAKVMQDKSVFVEALKDSENKLKELLIEAGATTDDLNAIVEYLGQVETDLDTESQVGCW